MSKFSELIKGDKPVLVDFFADWCGPCKTMEPIIKQAKSKIGNGATVVKVNVDKNQHAAQQYSVRSIPTLILFKNGKPVWRKTGVVPAKEIVEAVRRIG